jgi:Arc/MetJ-type ribon-helix-helix transcriptional regulator
LPFRIPRVNDGIRTRGILRLRLRMTKRVELDCPAQYCAGSCVAPYTWYQQSMTVGKVAVAIPEPTLARARAHVEGGRAKSLSALVSEALEEKLSGERLAAVLADMDATSGIPSKKARAWAKKILP